MGCPNFDRLSKVFFLDGEPDRVPFYELFADREIMEAVTGEPLSKMDSRRSREEVIQYLKDMIEKELIKHNLKVIIKFYSKLGYDYVPLSVPSLCHSLGFGIKVESRLRSYAMLIVLILITAMLIDITALSDSVKAASTLGLSIGVGIAIGVFAIWFFFHEYLDRSLKIETVTKTREKRSKKVVGIINDGDCWYKHYPSS